MKCHKCKGDVDNKKIHKSPKAKHVLCKECNKSLHELLNKHINLFITGFIKTRDIESSNCTQ